MPDNKKKKHPVSKILLQEEEYAEEISSDIDGLNFRERDFCKQYVLLKGNGTKAAIAAGYAEKGAGARANALLKKEKIKAQIKLYKEDYALISGVSPEMLLIELLGVAFSNIADYLKEDWGVKELSEISRAKIAAVRKVTVRTLQQKDEILQKTVTVEMYSKLEAIKQLAQMVGYDKPPAKTDEQEPEKLPSGSGAVYLVGEDGRRIKL